MAIPSFDYATFIAQYPMYSTSPSQAVLTNLWTQVNVVGTPIIGCVPDASQSYYYYLVLAHLAELWLRGPGAVGIVSSSTQGTVSIGLEVPKSQGLIWWNQTQWGQQIAQIIMMRGGFTFIYGGHNYYDRYS